MDACRQVNVDRWIGFNRALSFPRAQRSRTGVHFFLDDYRFQRVWNFPDRYLPILSTYGAVCSPDFSVYDDFPAAIQLYNQYRNAWLGRYWQTHGINVVPTVLWRDPWKGKALDDFWTCYPEDSIVVISSVGCMDSPEGRAWFSKGLQEVRARLFPKLILIYGDIPDECGGEDIVHLPSFAEELRMRVKGK